jgi:hypothetical protein
MMVQAYYIHGHKLNMFNNPGLSFCSFGNNNHNRYWVGGTSSWNGTATGKWAYVSGGAAIAREPTASDNVFFDANSGSGTTTIATTIAKCKNLDFTGFTGTLAGSTSLIISGSLTLSSGMGRTYTGSILFNSTTTGNTITSNGKTLASSITFNGSGGYWTLNDAISTTQGINTVTGTFDSNNFNITSSFGESDSGNVRSVILGSSTWTITATAGTAWLFSGTNLTFLPGTSTILANGSSTSSDRNFVGGGLTYNNLQNTGTSTGALLVTGSNTFKNISINPSCNIKLEASSTTTLTGSTPLSATGTSGHAINIAGITAANYNIISANNINTDYINISHCQFSGGSTWHAGANSTNGGNNSGITFP